MDEEEPEPTYDGLTTVNSGRVGTLQVMKSGDCRLVLGGETYDVDRGLETSMLQQVVSVDTAKQELTVLGPVGKKLVVTFRPDYNYFKEPRRE